jgi:sortase A
VKLRIVIPETVPQTVVRSCLLAIGIACLGTCGYAYLDRVWYQAHESREFERTLALAAATSAPATGTMLMADRHRRSPGDSGPSAALIGRLSVPRLRLSAMVREGIDRSTLQVAIGHIPATALPGQTGNVGVAGHRDTFFRGLKDLKAEDEIRITTLSGDFSYIVESLRIVEPDNVGVLAPSSDNVLTLVTCYPFSYVGTAPRRFVVRARQVSPQSAPL